eukprot:TRINITY_DN3015_c0_g1_i3.p1 TRINITY_DN3015_c0_g1~~TRINITY_DN3015_c0_g1_i3.p1  ORF type:complete len:623 (-),score=159.81 TRINITY_DN3015_c0_g1_i3:215-2083(-)
MDDRKVLRLMEELERSQKIIPVSEACRDLVDFVLSSEDPLVDVENQTRQRRRRVGIRYPFLQSIFSGLEHFSSDRGSPNVLRHHHVGNTSPSLPGFTRAESHKADGPVLNITALPTEVLCSVLYFLPARALISVLYTCRILHNVGWYIITLYSEHFQRELFIEKTSLRFDLPPPGVNIWKVTLKERDKEHRHLANEHTRWHNMELNTHRRLLEKHILMPIMGCGQYSGLEDTLRHLSVYVHKTPEGEVPSPGLEGRVSSSASRSFSSTSSNNDINNDGHPRPGDPVPVASPHVRARVTLPNLLSTVAGKLFPSSSSSTSSSSSSSLLQPSPELVSSSSSSSSSPMSLLASLSMSSSISSEYLHGCPLSFVPASADKDATESGRGIGTMHDFCFKVDSLHFRVVDMSPHMQHSRTTTHFENSTAIIFCASLKYIRPAPDATSAPVPTPAPVPVPPPAAPSHDAASVSTLSPTFEPSLHPFSPAAPQVAPLRAGPPAIALAAPPPVNEWEFTPLQHSLNMFRTLCSISWLDNVPIIVLFSGATPFEADLSAQDLRTVFPLYTGGPDYQRATKFLKRQYGACNTNPARKIYTYFVRGSQPNKVPSIISFYALLYFCIHLCMLVMY